VRLDSVCLDREPVTNEHTVTEEVRKEKIELDDDGPARR
jgi:hypothetical protein